MSDTNMMAATIVEEEMTESDEQTPPTTEAESKTGWFTKLNY